MSSEKRIQCLDRSLDLLELVAGSNGMGVSEIANKLNLHAATTQNIIRTLNARQYLVKGGGKYRIGPGAAFLPGSYDPASALPEIIGPYLDEITERTGATTGAAVLLGKRAKTIYSNSGDSDSPRNSQATFWPYPLRIATGKLLTAFRSEEYKREIIEIYLAEKDLARHEREPSMMEDWLKKLDLIKKREFVLVDRTQPVPRYALAAPIKISENNVIAAIGLVIRDMKLPKPLKEKMRLSLIDAAKNISENLGYTESKLS